MPYRHVYQSFEVRRLLQQAEHSPSPITGVDAHSRGLHAIRTPGGVGVSQAEMMDRTHKRVGESNNAFKNRGGAVRTSTFKNVIQQADAACQALNSPKGQQALGLLDAPVHAGKNLRLTLEVGPIREAGFLGATPAPRMHTVHKNNAAVQSPTGGARGVRVIIDRAPGQAEIHIQTCFPLDNLANSSFTIRDMGANVNVATG
ncbi:MAG: hypothetical protein KC613_14625 [Myxococcales bacterium]|nr:hypothetical protein [Myxococcales bacterium]MCB9524814.1 hypothetical protein [Myxococcales bacterium]